MDAKSGIFDFILRGPLTIVGKHYVVKKLGFIESKFAISIRTFRFAIEQLK
jgi:hypothetical protein